MERLRRRPLLMRTTLALAGIVLVLGLTIAPSVSPAKADDDDDPRFEVYVPAPTLEPGTDQTVTVKLVNDEEDIDESNEEARNVKVTMKSGKTPITVNSGTELIGDMPDGEVKTVSFDVSVPANIDAGSYDLPIELNYEFEDDERGSKTVRPTFRVNERVRFAVVSTDADISVGETGRVNITLENVGSETASGAAVTLTALSDDVTVGSSTSDSLFAGTIDPGERRTVSYRVSVARDGDPRPYSLEATVDYEDEDGNERVSRTLNVGITPSAEQRFAVTDVTSTLKVGHEGVLAGTVENQGPNNVSNAVIVLSTDDPKVEPIATEYAIGPLAKGESVPFEFQVMTTDDAGFGPRQFTVEVRYRDRLDERQTGDPIDVRAIVDREQVFQVHDVSGDLRVGEEGTLGGTLTNNGEQPVRNAVVVFTSDNSNVNPIDTEYLVGDLEPGQSASFDFDIEISEGSGAGPRQLSVEVRYRDANDDVRRSDPLDLRTRIAPKREVFEVDPTSNAVTAGRGATFTVSVTNAGNETLSDISAKLFTDDPLSSDDDEAFIDSLDPGESRTVTFGLAAAGSALTKSYPVSIDFQYQEPDGDTRLSDTFRVPVEVQEPTREGPPMSLIFGAVIVVVLVGAAGFYLYRQRQ